MKTYKSPIPEITLKYKSGALVKAKITTSEDAYKMLMEMYDSDTLEYTESFIVIYLSKSNNTLGWQRMSSGGTAGTVVDVKVLMTTALKCNAHGIIISHNHPSGALRPSEQDLALTKNMVKAGEFLEIPILDHIIVTTSGYYSFADSGVI
jgi:DNA repair protein RadC